jgi:hypothetical protein
MFTKKDYAEYIIKEFAEENETSGVTVEDIKNNPDNYVFQSTSVGLALEILGLLEGKKTLKRYLSERGGSWLMYIPDKKETAIPRGRDIKQMSTREFFSLLPDAV